MTSKKGAEILWREVLLPMGLKLLRRELKNISNGIINKIPQSKDLSTFEPSLENIKDLYNPDVLMLLERNPITN